MAQPGTESQPLRVAIIGAGPAGFYAADHLFKQPGLMAQIEMFDSLPTPYGLVRLGVAPDHQKIKSVVTLFDTVAENPRFRFYGNVEFGRHLHRTDLRQYYHQIIYATGAQTDRRMNILGEDLRGSYPATEFVAWYNGHPDFRDHHFDLSHQRAAVVGMGNVALDVARILCRLPNELAKTDMADHAIAALSQSRVREVYMLGRRGPAQAAFTLPELKELGQLTHLDIMTLPTEVQLDPLSRAHLERSSDRSTWKKVEILQGFAHHPPTDKLYRLVIRFLVSPVEIIGDAAGQVKAIRLVKNELVETPTGQLKPQPTDQFEELPVDLVFRSVGYQGVPLPGVPFDPNAGVILNERGRVLNPETQQPEVGEYTAGWIKRGPTGVIGTNKPDAAETVASMMADLVDGRCLAPAHPQPTAIAELVRQRQPHFFSYDDWLRLNEIEIIKGKEMNRPRVKFTRINDMLAALKK
jgi:ferredoxin--NADP+ reductase